MSGKIPDMTARLRAAVVSTDLVEVVDTAGTDNYKVLLADLMELAFDPSPVLAAGLDAADFTISNIGGLLPNDNGVVLGSAALPFLRLHYSDDITTGTARAGFKGGHVYYDETTGDADLFFGHDQVFDGYYAQRTTVLNSTVTDNTEDYTNLYQGGLGAEFIALGWECEGEAAIDVTINTSGLLKGGTIFGEWSSSTSRGGSGAFFSARANRTGTILQHHVDTDIFWCMRSDGYGSMSGAVKGWRIGGDIEHIEPSDTAGAQNDNSISFGLIGNRWSDVFAVKGTFSNDTGSASVVLDLDQNDVDEPFIDFRGTTGGNATSSISTWTTGQTIQGHIQIDINGTKRWIPFYDDPTA